MEGSGAQGLDGGWGVAFLIFSWRIPGSVAVGHDPGDFRKVPYDFTNKECCLGVAWYIHLRMLGKRELKSSQIQLSIFKQISNLKNSCTYYPINFHLLLLHFYFLLIYEKASVAYQNLVFKADLLQSHTTWHKGKNVPHIIFSYWIILNTVKVCGGFCFVYFVFTN